MIAEVRDKIVAFIGDDPIMGHNVDFDISFFKAAGIDLSGHVVFDTFKLAQLVFWRERSMNLGHLCEVIGMPFSGQHRALEDTRATVRLFLAIVSRFQSMLPEELQILSYVVDLPGTNPFPAFVRGFLDMQIGNSDRDAIKNLIFSRLQEYKKIERSKNPDLALGVEDIMGSKTSGSLEERPEQMRMAHMVEQAFSQSERHLIEAPTGIGKTFAYLVPSILLALRTGKQVFVSTNTKTLQDQVVYKDIPQLRNMFSAAIPDEVFSVAKVKGRRNYLGLLPFFDFLENETFEEHEIMFIGKILLWLLTTETGEMDEINYYGKENQLLKLVSADDRRVLEAWNPHKNHEFLYKARMGAKDAHIVVINHALLTQDSDEASAKILPEVEYLIVDEAHNLESVATESFKHSATLQ